MVMGTVRDGDVLIVCISANGPYASLAYRALTLPVLHRLDPLVFADDLRSLPPDHALLKSGSKALICIGVIDVEVAKDGSKDPLVSVFPIRWAQVVEDFSRDSIRLRLGPVVDVPKGAHGRRPSAADALLVEREHLANCLTAVPSRGANQAVRGAGDRAAEVGERLRHPFHPYLVAAGCYEDLKRMVPTGLKLPRRLFDFGDSAIHSHHGLRIADDVLMDDADRWQDVSELVHQVVSSTVPVHDSRRPYFVESSLRIVKVEVRRRQIISRIGRPWHPVCQEDIGDLTVYKLKRRRAHQILVRSRMPSKIDRFATFKLEMFSQVGTVRDSRIQITAGTLNHPFTVLTGDKRLIGEMSLQMNVRPTEDASNGSGAVEKSYLPIGLKIVGIVPAASVTLGVSLLSLGIASGMLGVVTPGHHAIHIWKFKLFRIAELMTTAGMLCIAVAVALLTFGLARWSRD
jgi:hypothetical protein